VALPICAAVVGAGRRCRQRHGAQHGAARRSSAQPWVPRRCVSIVVARRNQADGGGGASPRVATALSPCGDDVWPAALGGVVLRSSAASAVWRRRWRRGLPAATVVAPLLWQRAPASLGSDGPRRAWLGLLVTAGCTWCMVAAGRRGDAEVLPGEGGGWIPSVQPRLVDRWIEVGRWSTLLLRGAILDSLLSVGEPKCDSLQRI
jgi:hypothetical protein